MFPPFDDPDIQRMPPSQVRILDLHAEPWPDGRRVRVHLDLTPFEQKPNIDLEISTADGQLVASSSIVESMTSRLVITMHLRSADPTGSYTLQATVSYPDADPVAICSVAFTILPDTSQPG
jgi:hypothetical protein